MKLIQPSRLLAMLCVCLLLGHSLVAVAHAPAMFAVDMLVEDTLVAEHDSHAHAVGPDDCQADSTGWCALACSLPCISRSYQSEQPHLSIGAMVASLPWLADPFIADPLPPPRYSV